MKINVKRLGFLGASVLFSAFLFLAPRASLEAAMTIQNGSVVSMHYTLTVDGKIVDSSVGKSPLLYTQGAKQIIPGLEEKLAGLKAGDKTQVRVSPEKGYGKMNPEAVQRVPRAALKDIKGLKVGSVVTGQSGNRPVQAKVRAIAKETVTLDMNHPLAGKTLNFDVEIVAVKPAAKN